jgi:hypothetical protein
MCVVCLHCGRSEALQCIALRCMMSTSHPATAARITQQGILLLGTALAADVHHVQAAAARGLLDLMLIQGTRVASDAFAASSLQRRSDAAAAQLKEPSPGLSMLCMGGGSKSLVALLIERLEEGMCGRLLVAPSVAPKKGRKQGGAASARASASVATARY